MKYFSLNHNSKSTLFHDAVKRGLAPDRGLYFPETIPQLPQSFFEDIEKMSIPQGFLEYESTRHCIASN